DLERGRVDRVAAKVAQEVGVLLEHEDLDAGPGEEEPEHNPGRPSTGDAAGRRERGHGSGRYRRRPLRCSRAHAEERGRRWPGGRLATAASRVRAGRHSLAARTPPRVPAWPVPPYHAPERPVGSGV